MLGLHRQVSLDHPLHPQPCHLNIQPSSAAAVTTTAATTTIIPTATPDQPLPGHSIESSKTAPLQSTPRALPPRLQSRPLPPQATYRSSTTSTLRMASAQQQLILVYLQSPRVPAPRSWVWSRAGANTRRTRRRAAVPGRTTAEAVVVVAALD